MGEKHSTWRGWGRRGKALSVGFKCKVGGVQAAALALAPALTWVQGWIQPQLLPFQVASPRLCPQKSLSLLFPSTAYTQFQFCLWHQGTEHMVLHAPI